MNGLAVTGASAVLLVVIARWRERRSSWWTAVIGLASGVAGGVAFAFGVWPVGLALLVYYFLAWKRWADRVEVEE